MIYFNATLLTLEVNITFLYYFVDYWIIFYTFMYLIVQ